MSELPDPIPHNYFDNEGFSKTKDDKQLLLDLVYGFNELVRYLNDKDQPHEG